MAESSYKYETVAVSQTDQALGATGAKGDFLKRLVICVATSATSSVSIKDGGGTAIKITEANSAIGVYTVDIDAYSAVGAWSVSTNAGATVMAIGNFT
jgi:hypothetical protein